MLAAKLKTFETLKVKNMELEKANTELRVEVQKQKAFIVDQTESRRIT